MMPAYDAKLTLTDDAGKTKTLTGTLSDGDSPQPSPSTMDFTAKFDAFPSGHVIMSTDEWKKIFADGIGQGASIYCLEDNTDATRHDFKLGNDGTVGPYVELFMPKGSYGMGHRSVNIGIGRPKTPINATFKWCCPTPAGGVNLWTAGGGKWGGAWQYGPIQSGSTGGVRMFGIWAAGASTLGKQDIVIGLQNQPDGGQWVQPPYYGHRPIIYDHWYDIRYRMTGGSEAEPKTVRIEYWKDQDPVMDYTAKTNNPNCKAGAVDVFFDLTAFFGGGVANAAPADARFRFADLRIWVENE